MQKVVVEKQESRVEASDRSIEARSLKLNRDNRMRKRGNLRRALPGGETHLTIFLRQWRRRAAGMGRVRECWDRSGLRWDRLVVAGVSLRPSRGVCCIGFGSLLLQASVGPNSILLSSLVATFFAMRLLLARF